jgi:hypothetical protein
MIWERLKMIAQENRKKNFFIFYIVFFSLFLLPITSESAYKIYLKNGRVMRGVDDVKKDAGRLKIYKNGIMLELPKTRVIKIEEYGIKTTEKETAEKVETPEGKELPEYIQYLDKKAYQERIQRENQQGERELQQLNGQLQSILNKLERIETLEKKSNILKRKYYKELKRPKYRKEKAEIDQELEAMNKDLLLEQKKELESRIDSLKRK